VTTDEHRCEEPDLEERPFEIVSIEGIPFGKDSEEARAIERIIERADRARALAEGRPWPPPKPSLPRRILNRLLGIS